MYINIETGPASWWQTQRPRATQRPLPAEFRSAPSTGTRPLPPPRQRHPPRRRPPSRQTRLRAGLCYQFYHYRFYQFGPDNSVIGLISFVPMTYQRGSQGQPLKPAPRTPRPPPPPRQRHPPRRRPPGSQTRLIIAPMVSINVINLLNHIHLKAI
jgi:hypothetical protein